MGTKTLSNGEITETSLQNAKEMRKMAKRIA